MECDKLYHNNQDFIHLIRVLMGINFERCLIIPIFFLALIIFSSICFLKDKTESRIRPKCFCSFTFLTTVPLKISCG